MPTDLKAEIARRLDVSSDEVEPVLEAVVERIRRQVDHYGYARLANLGTFRGKDGQLTFEPDSALEEAVNLRFVGLEPIRVQSAPDDEALDERPLSAASAVGIGDERAEAPDEPDDADDELVGGGEAPIGGREEPIGGDEEAVGGDEETTSDDWEGELVDREGEPIDWEGERAADEDAETADFEGDLVGGERDEPADWEGERVDHEETPVDWEGDLVEDRGEPVSWEGDLVEEEPADRADERMDTPEEPEYDEQLFDASARDETGTDEEEDAFDEEDGEAIWFASEDESKDHPLGPVGPPPYEDADFSVVGERESTEEGSRSLGELSDEYESPDELEPTAPDDEGDREPTVAWVEPGDDLGDEDADGDRSGDDDGDQFDEGDENDAEEAAAAVPAAKPEANQAPDRGARPHEAIRSDRPSQRPVRAAVGGAARRNTIWIGVGVIVLVAAAAVAYFTLQTTEPTEPTPAEQAQAEPIPSADTAAAEVDTAATASAEEPPAESTPLRSSEGFDRSAGGYTIIVFSETSESAADEAAQRYRDEGYRTGVLTSTQNGVTRYRVGVGQFAEMNEATNTRNELAGGELPDDAWVLRIR